MPPLRERREDIALLVHYFVRRYASRIGRRIGSIPAATMARLAAYSWPGNIRELENVIERAMILSTGPELELAAELIPPPRAAPASGAAAELATWTAENGNSAAASRPLADAEKQHIIAVLKSANWRIEGSNGAANILKVNPSTLRSRMKKLGVARSRDGAS
jgi:DNA-binding NtrC family response regulator